VPKALSAPLAPQLETENLPVDMKHAVAVICAGGYRSSAAASLLARRGFSNLFNITGGTGAWISAGHPVEEQG
ncbi:MAG: rhodanese-like domain-containing protein, partial [Pyrinomonadaceae bacterium]